MVANQSLIYVTFAEVITSKGSTIVPFLHLKNRANMEGLQPAGLKLVTMHIPLAAFVICTIRGGEEPVKPRVPDLRMAQGTLMLMAIGGSQLNEDELKNTGKS